MTSSKKINNQIIVFLGVVIKDGKSLMILRNEPECPKAHLKWEWPGGKADLGETPQQALMREFLEETGVTIKVGRLLSHIQVSNWEYAWGIQQTILFGFECKFISQTKMDKMDHHAKKVEWVGIDKIKKLKSLPGTNEFFSAALKSRG